MALYKYCSVVGSFIVVPDTHTHISVSNFLARKTVIALCNTVNEVQLLLLRLFSTIGLEDF